MPDSLGWRMKLGIVVPSTNTSVQPEFDAMRPAGVTNHVSRIGIPNMALTSDADFERLIAAIEAALPSAVDQVMTCEPGHLVLGMSAETFWNGRDGSEALKTELERRAGTGVTLGSHACRAAMSRYGDIRRIGVITPYFPVGDGQVRRFFAECGLVVAGIKGLKCESPTAIAHVQPEALRAAVREVDGPNVDLIIQVGTNLAFAGVAAEAEAALGKPVLAINTCTYWHALRTLGMTDQVDGFGSLLSRF